jgi:hypothetical protein
LFFIKDMADASTANQQMGALGFGRNLANAVFFEASIIAGGAALPESAAAESTALRLPASMADELPTYQQAAGDGLLMKVRSSDLPASNARAIWENVNGPVPEGFDVDHIIQRQFGGTDELSNLQLKASGLNRSQGAQSMWLNKAQLYGTVFDNVELSGKK